MIADKGVKTYPKKPGICPNCGKEMIKEFAAWGFSFHCQNCDARGTVQL